VIRRTYTDRQKRAAIAAARAIGLPAAAAAHDVPVGTLRSWLHAERPAVTYDASRLVDAAGCSLRTAAARLGVDPAVLCRPLSERQADRYATALDLHPSEVWR
jgi:hypothetical protein